MQALLPWPDASAAVCNRLTCIDFSQSARTVSIAAIADQCQVATFEGRAQLLAVLFRGPALRYCHVVSVSNVFNIHQSSLQVSDYEYKIKTP